MFTMRRATSRVSVTAMASARFAGTASSTHAHTSWFSAPRAMRTGAVVMGMAASAFTAGTVVVWCSPVRDTPPFDYSGIRQHIEDLIADEPALGPTFVRLAWHEAGSWDASAKNGSPNSAAMRFEPQCKFAANAGLEKGRAALEPVKKKNPKISYADLWVLAACVAVDAAGGPSVTFRYGRPDVTAKDKPVVPDGRLPDGALGVDHVRETFKRMGFNDQEAVALIGAHALGECREKNSGFVGPWTHDRYGFSNSFFTELMNNEWIVDKRRPKLQFTDSATKTLMMLPTDMALLFDPSYKKWVQKYADDNDVFERDFAKAFQKLLELNVATKLKAVA